MLGLGYLGLGSNNKAKDYLSEAANMDLNHQGVEIQLGMHTSK